MTLVNLMTVYTRALFAGCIRTFTMGAVLVCVPYYAAPLWGQTGSWTPGTNILGTNASVGVGTLNPTLKLEVNSAGMNNGMALYSGGTSNYTFLALGRASAEAYIAMPGGAGQFSPAALAGDLVIRSDGKNILFTTDAGSTNQMYLRNGGNVGIGTVAPGANLQIGSLVNAMPLNTSLAIGTLNGPSATVPAVRFSMGVNNDANYGGYLGTLWLSASTGQTATVLGTREGGGDYVNTLAVTRGSVGIGTIAPGRLLHLSGNSQPGFAITETGGTAGQKSMGFVYDGGAIVSGGGLVWQSFTDTGGFSGNLSTFFRNGSVNFGGITAPGAAGQVVFTGGNVGIGTTAPTSKLAVNGTISTKEVIVTNTGWSDYVFKPNYHLTQLHEVAAYNTSPPAGDPFGGGGPGKGLQSG